MAFIDTLKTINWEVGGILVGVFLLGITNFATGLISVFKNKPLAYPKSATSVAAGAVHPMDYLTEATTKNIIENQQDMKADIRQILRHNENRYEENQKILDYLRAIKKIVMDEAKKND